MKPIKNDTEVEYGIGTSYYRNGVKHIITKWEKCPWDPTCREKYRNFNICGGYRRCTSDNSIGSCLFKVREEDRSTLSPFPVER